MGKMYDHENEDMTDVLEFPFPTAPQSSDVITLSGVRQKSTVVNIEKTTESNPYRDAVVLEAFLSTALPEKTVVILTQLLYKRNIEPHTVLGGLDMVGSGDVPTAKKPARKKKVNDSEDF